MVFTPDIVSLDEFESFPILPREERGPGVYTQKMSIQGNSLLSSVYIEAADAGASVEVKYYDTSTGTNVGERFDLDSHPVLDDTNVDDTSRVIVTRIHDKPIVEATVLSGNVTFGVYVTVVSQFAADIDSALILDGETFVSSTNKAIPIACLNSSTGELEFIRCPFPVSFEEEGTPVLLKAVGVTTTPGSLQTLITETVPALTTRKLSQSIVVCNFPGTYSLKADGAIIGSGRTGPANSVSRFPWNPRQSVAAGLEIKLEYTAVASVPSVDIEAYLMGSDIV